MLGYTFTYRNSVKSKSETVTSKRFVRLKNEKKSPENVLLDKKLKKDPWVHFVLPIYYWTWAQLRIGISSILKFNLNFNFKIHEHGFILIFFLFRFTNIL